MNNMINNNINSIERMAEVISKRKKQDVNASYDGPSFTEILSRQKSIDELVSERTDVKKAVTGQIRFTDDQMTRLEEGTKKASDKGIKESLVLVDDLAFIVNTDKKMVITAIDQNSSEDNIYTNIDGAVII